MSTPGIKITQSFAHYLLVEVGITPPEYLAYLGRGDVTIANKTRGGYCRLCPVEALDSVARHWNILPVPKQKLILQAYSGHLNVAKLRQQQKEVAWLSEMASALGQPSDAQPAAEESEEHAANDARIDTLIEGAQAPFTAAGMRREILDLRTALHQAWLRMSKESRDDLVRLYGTMRMSRQPEGEKRPLHACPPAAGALPIPPTEDVPKLTSKLFIIGLRQGEGVPPRHVAVRSHSHDGARTRLYGSEWYRVWADKNGRQTDQYVHECGLAVTDLEEVGVLPVAVDEEVVKVHTARPSQQATETAEAP